MLRAGFPSFSAVSSLLVYFAYNYLVFDGIIPVSGAVKTWRAQQVWDEEGRGDDLAQNFESLVSLWPLWERIEPHFDYQFQSEPVGIIVDGRLVLSIARDCAVAERDIILQYTTGDGETNTSTQHPRKTGEEGGNTLTCGDITLLPSATIHPLRIWLTPKDVLERDLALYGFDRWRLDGDAVTIYGQHERTVYQQPISGNVTKGLLTSYHPNRGDAETGTARSPEFTGADDHLLTFLIAGGGGAWGGATTG